MYTVYSFCFSFLFLFFFFFGGGGGGGGLYLRRFIFRIFTVTMTNQS